MNSKTIKKRVTDLQLDDLVDLSSCPFLKKHPSAQFEYGQVVHIERETDACIVIGYEGIDHIGYPVETELLVAVAVPA